MEQQKKTLKDIVWEYNPNSNVLYSSKLTDNQGNVNLFKMIVDKDQPFLQQKVGNAYARTSF